MKKIFYIFLLAALFASCIEDGFTTSPSDQPVFSTDTLALGVVYTEDITTTRRFIVHNPHDKQLSISKISLSGTASDYFRLNVDGISGREFSAVDIRGNDSIFVFVEATLPRGDKALTDFEAKIDFNTNGITNSVVLTAQGQNVRRLKGHTITLRSTFDDELPYLITDSLVVAPDALLTIKAGAQLLFHDKAMLIVRGRLSCEGTAEKPIVMTGDRTGNVVTDISFDIMSRQWVGAFFTYTSHNNVLRNTIIKNTVQGVMIEGSSNIDYTTNPQLTLINCRLRNSGDLVLESYHSAIRAIGCEFAEAAGGLVYLQGGKHIFNHCTFANYYLFAAVSGPALWFAHLGENFPESDDQSGLPATTAEVSNSIIHGYGGEVSHGDLTGSNIFIRNCLLKSAGKDDDNFINCIWDADPLFYTVREDYFFDYRLKPESPAIGAADPALTLPEASIDGYGLSRTAPADLGAYVFTPPADEDISPVL